MARVDGTLHLRRWDAGLVTRRVLAAGVLAGRLASELTHTCPR